MIKVVIIAGLALSLNLFAKESESKKAPEVYLIVKCNSTYDGSTKLIHQSFHRFEGYSKNSLKDIVKGDNKEMSEGAKALLDGNYCYLLNESSYLTESGRGKGGDIDPYGRNDELQVLIIWDTPNHVVDVHFESKGRGVDCNEFYMDSGGDHKGCWNVKTGPHIIVKHNKYKSKKKKHLLIELHPEFIDTWSQEHLKMNILIKEGDKVIFERKNFSLRWGFYP